MTEFGNPVSYDFLHPVTSSVLLFPLVFFLSYWTSDSLVARKKKMPQNLPTVLEFPKPLQQSVGLFSCNFLGDFSA